MAYTLEGSYVKHNEVWDFSSGIKRTNKWGLKYREPGSLLWGLSAVGLLLEFIGPSLSSSYETAWIIAKKWRKEKKAEIEHLDEKRRMLKGC